jgi:hypothetical protein
MLDILPCRSATQQELVYHSAIAAYRMDQRSYIPGSGVLMYGVWRVRLARYEPAEGENENEEGLLEGR